MAVTAKCRRSPAASAQRSVSCHCADRCPPAGTADSASLPQEKQESLVTALEGMGKLKVGWMEHIRPAACHVLHSEFPGRRSGEARKQLQALQLPLRPSSPTAPKKLHPAQLHPALHADVT